MIFGPETWKEINAVTFVYWDRWFLRLATDEKEGLDGLAERFRADRKRLHGYQREDAEAKLSHLADLKRRLEHLGVAPEDVLGAVDTGDKKLLAKSRTKLFDQALARKSPAMIDTPRRRLQARSLRGQWDVFPVSPARFEAELWKGRDRHAYYDWRLTMWLADDLGSQVEQLALFAESEAEALALQRALLTLIVERMDGSDDSHASLGMLFEETWTVYVAMPWERTGIAADAYFRDLIEFSIWEDYGLVQDLTPLFRGLALDDAAVVEGVFADVIPELRDGGFDYQEEQALRYRVDFLVAQGLHEKFVDAATELGSRSWMPIVAMAKAALDAGKNALAMAIFSAADQPGPRRDILRQECTKMLGSAPEADRV